MDAPMLVASVLLGLVVGVLSGMLGIGGGMVMIPLFRLGFAMQAVQATATSLFTVIPTSVAGLVKHIRAGTCLPALGVAAGIGGALISPLGARLADSAPGLVIMLATAAIIASSSISMLRSALAYTQDAEAGRTAGNSAAPRDFRLSARTLAVGVLVGIVSGFAAGFVGLGGGFIMIPIFVWVLGLPMKKASGTSLIAICILAIPGVIQHMMLGNVEVAIGLTMAAGSIPGAIVGASLVKRLPERTLRFAFSILLLLAAAMLAINEVAVSA